MKKLILTLTLLSSLLLADECQKFQDLSYEYEQKAIGLTGTWHKNTSPVVYATISQTYQLRYNQCKAEQKDK